MSSSLKIVSNAVPSYISRVWRNNSFTVLVIIYFVAFCTFKLYKYIVSFVESNSLKLVCKKPSNDKLEAVSNTIVPSGTTRFMNLVIDSATAKSIEYYTDLNRRNIENAFYVTKLLFYGPPGCGQEIIAKNMAQDLNLKFHCFDGRKLSNDEYRRKTGWHFLFQRLSGLDTPEFVFISHADDICRNRNINISSLGESISTILGYTGASSKGILLCLGVSSLENLDPAIYSDLGIGSRYRDLLYVPLPGIMERIGILNLYLPQVFQDNLKNAPSQEQVLIIAEKAIGLSGKSLKQLLQSLYNQEIDASKWTEELIEKQICLQLNIQEIPLPSRDERIRMIQESSLNIPKILNREQILSIGIKTEGYSKQMIWSMLLDISNKMMPTDHSPYTALNEEMIHRVVEKWVEQL